MENNLFIPVGMKPEKEFFQGFARREMMQSIVAGIALLLIAGITYSITENMFHVIGILLFGITSIIAVVTRSAVTNLSVLDQLWYLIRFFKEQQEYRYRKMPE